MPVKVFFCYSHEDEILLKKLQTHLRPLQREGLIDVWHDRDISAGTFWDQEIKDQLNSSQIILLLVSPDFMASDYCYSVEMKLALERHERGDARVIPVILRHVYWQGILGTLQALPQDGLPIIDPDWHNIDRALFNVIEGLLKVVDELKLKHSSTLNTEQTQSTKDVPIEPPSKQESLVEPVDYFEPVKYTGMRPLIGIPCHIDFGDRSRRPIYGNDRTYIRAVERTGGVSVLIPLYQDLSLLDALLPRLDGLLLSGGVDIEPTRYGEKQHPLTGEPDKILDEIEFFLASWAVEEDVPTLGIGRGMQVLNVAMGGTLYQDVHELHPGSLPHLQREHPRDFIAHTVEVQQGSIMEKVLGTRSIKVNSLHHQAVKEPGKGVSISGRAEDGIAEMLELPGSRFILGVQYHPEEIYTKDAPSARLFSAFIRACRYTSDEEFVNVYMAGSMRG